MHMDKWMKWLRQQTVVRNIHLKFLLSSATKCATAGCHNTLSHSASSGLNLTNWASNDKGNDAGAVVIPGNADYSTLFSFCNVVPT